MQFHINTALIFKATSRKLTWHMYTYIRRSICLTLQVLKLLPQNLAFCASAPVTCLNFLSMTEYRVLFELSVFSDWTILTLRFRCIYTSYSTAVKTSVKINYSNSRLIIFSWPWVMSNHCSTNCAPITCMYACKDMDTSVEITYSNRKRNV